MKRTWLKLGLVFFLLNGCGRSSDGHQGGAETRLCGVPASEFVEQSCIRDDDCSCEAHCDLGICARSCSQDSECGQGQRCDALGRCRPESDPSNLSPPRDATAVGAVQGLSPLVQVMGSKPYRADVRVLDADVSRARVVANPGVVVSCDGEDGDYGPHCLLTDLKPGRHHFHLRADGPTEHASDKSVRVVTPRGSTSVGVALRPEKTNGSEANYDRSGVYRGSAALASLGARLGTTDITELLRGVSLPLEAFAHAESGREAYVLSVRDPLHLFGRDDDWVLRISQESGGTWQVEGATRPYLTNEGDPDDTVVVTPVCTSAAFDGGLSFECTLELSGLYAGEARGLMSVRIALGRSADLPDNATPPPLPESTSPPVPEEERALALLPWESRVVEALRHPFGRQTDSVELVSTRMDTLAGGLSLWQCAASEGALEAACHRFWSAEAPGLVGVDSFPCTQHPPDTATGRVVCRSDSSGSPVDRCALMEAEFGCSADGGDSLPGYCTFAAAQRMALLPAAAAAIQCPQAYLCWQPPEAPPNVNGLDALESSVLDANLSGPFRTLGDLSCADTEQAFVTELTGVADLDLVRPSSAMLEACADDLERHGLGPDVSPALQHGPALLALSGSAGCLEPWRLEAALGPALELERQRALGMATTSQGAAASMGMRLLFQYVEVLGFVAREALESDTLTRVLTADAAPLASNERPLDEYLDISLDGWSMLLHPRVATALLHVPGAMVAEPDYRQLLAAAPLPTSPPLHHTQGVGLPVVLAETLSSQIEAARQLVSRARFAATGEAAALRRASRTLRSAVATLGLAQALAKRASPFSPGWWNRWEGAYGLAESGLGALLGEVAALRAGINPLGLDEAALPLYFFGDEETASQRFSAISDFLIGTTLATSSQAWAPAAVDRAQESLDVARGEWVTNRERALAEAMAAADVSRRLESIATTYGSRIINLCGDTSWSAASILEEWTSSEEYSVDSCFLDSSASCAGQLDDQVFDQMYDAVRPADVAVAVCVAAGMRRTLGPDNGHPDPDAALNRALDAVGWNVSTSGTPQAPTLTVADGGGSGSERTFSVGDETFLVTDLYQVQYPGLDLRTLGKATAECASVHPTGASALPGVADVLGRSPDANCFMGSIGDAYLQISDAVHEIQVAREELNELTESFGIAMDGCGILARSTSAINDLEEVKNGTITALRAAKLVADITHLTFSTILNDDSASIDLIKNVQAKTAAIGTIVSGSISLGLEFAIDTSTDYFDQGISKLERQAEVDLCLNEARQALVGIKSAALRVEKADSDARAAVATFAGMKDELDHVIREGMASLESERARTQSVAGARRPLANDRWVSEAVERFRREFRLAQRMMYLAVRAVEYEYQVSLPQRGAVLAAVHPSQLRSVLDELLVQAGTRRVNGNTPSGLVKVISLKQQLLQLSDRTTYDKRQRFAHYLASRKVYDKAGNYMGIEVPFRLAPKSGGNAVDNTVAIFAPGDCAERLWSVSASVLGAEHQTMWLGEDPPSFVRIDLQKANTFFSQRCGPGDESDAYVASVRPAVNLFADPVLGRPSGIEDAAADPLSAFTSARVRAFFGVPRAQLEQDEYSEGESMELAARGLYGEYKLFIPAGVLSRDGGDGLLLDAVDDILLRLDYVSVAR